MLTRELRAPRFVPRWGGKERTSDLQRAVRRALSPDPRAGSGRVSWLRSDVVAWRTHVACGAWDYRTAGRAGHNYVGRCYRSETHRARVAGIQRCARPGGRTSGRCLVLCVLRCKTMLPHQTTVLTTTNTLITSVCANDGQSGRPNIRGLRGGGARVKNRDASVRIAGSAGDPAHRLHRHITSRDEYASSGWPSQPATNPVSQLLLLVSQPHPLSSMRCALVVSSSSFND